MSTAEGGQDPWVELHHFSQTKSWPQSAFQNRLTKTTATHHDKVLVVEMKIFTHRLSQIQQCDYRALRTKGFKIVTVCLELIRESGRVGLKNHFLSF